MTEPARENRESRKHDVPWEIARTFEQDGLTVEIQRLPVGRPKYSMRVGSRRQDGEFSSHIGFRRVDDDTKVALVLPYAQVLAKLIKDAENYIHAQMGWDWDNWIEQKQLHEVRGEVGKPPTRITGKTARKKAKKHPQKQVEGQPQK